MKNFKLNTGGGDRFADVAEKAKEIAMRDKVIVEFDFNGILCLVSDKTVLEWLERDYMNAHTMDWKSVGDNCRIMYDHDTELELRSRQLENAKRWKKEAEERDKKEKEEEKIIVAQIGGVELEIISGKEDEYKEYVNKNSGDGYSRAVIDYSEAWAKLMQKEISNGKSVKECADETQKGLGYLGITGFQYGCAVKGLAYFWEHGEELRKWHNKEYGVSEDKEGVVNPAVLTIG